MLERVKLIKQRYDEITSKLTNKLPVKEMTELMKEFSSLEGVVELYRQYNKLEDEVGGIMIELATEEDEDTIDLLKSELTILRGKKEELNKLIKLELVPEDPNDGRNILIEIKGAAGGDEGNIFAGDLFKMYAKYAEAQNWSIEVLDVQQGSSGGYTSIQFMVNGDKVYSQLKYESGTHRVQRVPQTETQGRIHTSTATVLVMPEADDIDFEVKWSDIEMSSFRASGAGGQHVNKVDSAVRLKHLPSGLVVESQLGKSQHQNRETAFNLLKTRLYDQMIQDRLEKESEKRNSLIGRGDRSEKIRTYNYPQNRVSDHRFHITVNNLDSIMDGKLELIIEPLINAIQTEKLKGV